VHLCDFLEYEHGVRVLVSGPRRTRTAVPGGRLPDLFQTAGGWSDSGGNRLLPRLRGDRPLRLQLAGVRRGDPEAERPGRFDRQPRHRKRQRRQSRHGGPQRPRTCDDFDPAPARPRPPPDRLRHRPGPQQVLRQAESGVSGRAQRIRTRAGTGRFLRHSGAGIRRRRQSRL